MDTISDLIEWIFSENFIKDVFGVNRSTDNLLKRNDYIEINKREELCLLTTKITRFYILYYVSIELRNLSVHSYKNIHIMRLSYLTHNIEYISIKDSEFVCPQNHPQEILYKDISLDYQCETRIVINFGNFRGEVLDINIGPMQDYADIVEHDEVLNGIRVKLTAHIGPQ